MIIDGSTFIPLKQLALTCACVLATVCSAATQDFDGKLSVTYQAEQWTVDLQKNADSQGVRLKRDDGTRVTVAVLSLASNPARLNDSRERASFMRGMGNEKITSDQAAGRIKSVSVFGRPGYELTGTTDVNGKAGSYRAVMVPQGTDAIVTILITPSSDPMAVPELKAIWDSIKLGAAPVADPEAAARAALRREEEMQAAAAARSILATTTTAASDDLPALRVAVSSVNESRNSQGRGTINLNLSIVGEGLPPTVFVNQITVTKAVDNLGNVLGASMAGMSPAIMQSEMRSMMSLASMTGGGVGVRPLNGRASLGGSSRKAESLHYAEGTIELFLPSEANGSIIRIPNILSHAGRIEDPALAKHGIEFYFLPDQASYDEAKDQGAAGFQARATPPDFPNGVGFSFRDPSGRLAFHQLQEANGTVLRTNGTSSSGSNGNTTGTIRLPAPLPADAQLVFFVVIPEATKTVPFRVEDITLP